MEKIGIIGAMDSEVKELCAQLKDKKIVEYAGLTFNCGLLDEKEVVIVKSGIGKVNAALCTQALILKFEVTRVINTGIAGATGEGLGVFDFVVSSETVYHDVDTTGFGYKIGQLPGMIERFPADEAFANAVIAAFEKTDFAKEHKIIKGLIASGDQFISDKPKKDFIKTNFNPACVEMEGCAIAHACYVNKIPFVVIRCMSDMADETVEKTYAFNEDVCAAACARLVQDVISNM